MKKQWGEAENCDCLGGISKTYPLLYNLSHNKYHQIRNRREFYTSGGGLQKEKIANRLLIAINGL